MGRRSSDPLDGLAKGKLLFELRGYKLRGLWTLVKIKKAEKEWLLIKERDAWASTRPSVPPPSRSCRDSPSKSWVRDATPGEAIRRELERARRASAHRRAQGRRTDAGRDGASAAFSRAGWIFEPKLDGYRVLAARGGAEPRLLTRNGNDYSGAFPEVVRARAPRCPFSRLLLDGEVVALDDAGRPSFQRLQGRVAPAAARSTSGTPRSRRR